MGNPEPDTVSMADNVTEAITLVDNRSAPCAVGLIRAARAMEVLQPDDLLEVWSRDQFAPYEVPIWAENRGHTIETKEQVGKWPRRHWRFLIRHGDN